MKVEYELFWGNKYERWSSMYFHNKKDALLFQQKHGGELRTWRKKDISVWDCST